MKTQKPWDADTDVEKVRKYCAYQERCILDVQTKLRQMMCPELEARVVIDQMIDEGFLNEARFANAYVRGHFSMKSWGRIKIRQALRAKHLPENLILAALQELDEVVYYERLLSITEKKANSIDMDDWEARQKLKVWLLGKGYEHELIDLAIQKIGEKKEN